MARNDFVSTSGFSLPEELFRQRRRDAFISGGIRHPESQAADLRAAVSVGAERESRFAQIAEDRRFREESLAQQESQFERSQSFATQQAEFNRSFQESETEKQRKSAFAGGIAQAATTVAGFGILKYFKIF